MATDYAEKILRAAEIISTASLEKLEYDKTIICQIVSADNAGRGQYSVLDGSSVFFAYTDKVDYEVGEQVYVTVPNSDYNKQKLIVGRYMQNESSYYNYTSPWKKFVDVTGDLVLDTDAGNSGSILANGTSKSILLWEKMDIDNGEGYTCLGLQAAFKTWVADLGAAFGTYGLRLYVYYKRTLEDAQTSTVKFELNNTDMYGNPYSFDTFYRQEKLFDISGLGIITGIKVVLFQNNDFTTNANLLINSTQTSTRRVWDDTINDWGEMVLTAPMQNNILVNDIYLALGYHLDEFDHDVVLLYTPDSKAYSKDDTERTLKVRWIHLLEDSIECYNDASEIVGLGALHWYKYNLNNGVKDRWAGDFWEEISNEKNNFNISAPVNPNEAISQYKVIIETPLYDDLVSEAAATEHEIDEARAEYELRQNIFNGAKEKYAQSNSQSNYNAYLSAMTALEAAENFYNSLLSTYLADLNLYESNVLTFTNADDVASGATVDLVKGLSLSCDPDGYKGIYYLYDTTNAIQNSSEALKVRTIIAEYNSIVSGDTGLDEADTIIWKIPITNSMIETPQLGIEYGADDTVEYTDSHIIITRTNALQSGMIGTAAGVDVKQSFRIKNYYAANATNNVVSCSVQKGGLIYTAEKELLFGPKGTSGTDYTFLLRMQPGRSCLYVGDYSPLRIQASLYDFTNLPVEHFGNAAVTYSFFAADDLIKVGFCDVSGALFLNGDTTSPTGMSNEAIGNRGIAEKITIAANPEDSHTRCFIRCLTEDEIRAANNLGNSVQVNPMPYYTILQAEIAQNSATLGSVVLKTKLAIPCSASDEYDHIDGSNQIVYDTSGACKYYYKDQYLLYNLDNEAYTDIEWYLIHYEPLMRKLGPLEQQEWNDLKSVLYERNTLTGRYSLTTAWKSKETYYIVNPEAEDIEDDVERAHVTTKFNAYYPAISTGGFLMPPSAYTEGIGKRIAIIGERRIGADRIICWAQPLVMYQDVYSSSLINSWDGSLTVDEENGTIMSSMLGAGYKDAENRFNGVLLGNVSSKADGYAGTGLFGYNEGYQSFGFRSDGTAFLGKSGRGRIEFDGNQGSIYSMSYGTGADTGMKIDLDDGYIDILGTTMTALVSSDTTKTLLEGLVDLKQENIGIIADAKSKLTEEYQKGANYSKELETQYRDTINKYTTINKAITAILALTDLKANSTYEELNNNEAVLKILADNKLVLADLIISSYELSPEYKSTGSRVKIASFDPYFSIISNSKRHTELIHIGNDAYYLQTDNYFKETAEVLGSGVKIDLQDGSIDGYNFSLKATNADTASDYAGSYIWLSSEGTATSPYFSVRVKSAEKQSDIDLIKITQDQFVMHSQNWKLAATPIEVSHGIEFDLTNGSLTAYDGFTLYALDSRVNSQYKDSSFLISSTPMTQAIAAPGAAEQTTSPYLSIHYVDNTPSSEYVKISVDASNGAISQTSTGQLVKIENDLIHISPTEYILRSQKFGYGRTFVNPDDNKTYIAPLGTEVNMSDGKITSYNFNLLAFKSKSPSQFIALDSNAAEKPFRIVGEKQTVVDGNTTTIQPIEFSVNWNGRVTMDYLQATSGGQIGPFIITPKFLYTDSSTTVASSDKGVHIGADGLKVMSGDSGIQVFTEAVTLKRKDSYKATGGCTIISGDLYVTGNIYGGTTYSPVDDGGGGGSGGGGGGGGGRGQWFDNIYANSGLIGSGGSGWFIREGHLDSVGQSIILNSTGFIKAGNILIQGGQSTIVAGYTTIKPNEIKIQSTSLTGSSFDFVGKTKLDGNVILTESITLTAQGKPLTLEGHTNFNLGRLSTDGNKMYVGLAATLKSNNATMKGAVNVTGNILSLFGGSCFVSSGHATFTNGARFTNKVDITGTVIFSNTLRTSISSKIETALIAALKAQLGTIAYKNSLSTTKTFTHTFSSSPQKHTGVTVSA